VKVLIPPLVIGFLYIALCSLLMKEPKRQNFNAIMLAGAGAAYFSGGFGIWELVFTALVTFCAYQGLQSYRFIGVGWLLHTCWDVLHHLYGRPIIPFVPGSSLGCAISDPVIAAWASSAGPRFFADAGKAAACLEAKLMLARFGSGHIL
jgi:hypothetical protein